MAKDEQNPGSSKWFGAIIYLFVLNFKGYAFFDTRSQARSMCAAVVP
jgi:hypothetical protein